VTPPQSTIDSEGYSSNTFSGKPEQMVQVRDYIAQKGFLPSEIIEPEVKWFYGYAKAFTLSLSHYYNCRNLGIDDMYFSSESVEVISNHIIALYGAKMFAFIKNENQLEINLERETENGATFIHTSVPGVSQLTGKNYESL
jgi:glutamate dehydrogenase